MSRLRVAAAGGALLLAGCGAAPTAPAADAGGVTGTVTVFAAASLTETFTALGERFEQDHPGTTVTFNFGGSTALAQSVLAGAPADVFAAASPAAMQVVTRAGEAAGKPVVLARNELVLAVPQGNPGEVTDLDDLADPELAVALCAPQVPCGEAAAHLLEQAGVTPAPDTLEQDVKAALSKVALGEVDAALVYRTDVRASGGRVEGIEVPGAQAAANDYPAVVLAGAPNPAAARAFLEAAAGAQGREVLATAGFQLP